MSIKTTWSYDTRRYEMHLDYKLYYLGIVTFLTGDFFSPPSLNISQPGELSPGAFPNIPPPPFANGGKYPYPPGLLGFPGFLAQHPYGLERRSSSKSPTPEPAQSPSLREEEGSGNIWHPLSRIKVENNQNEAMGGFSEQEDQQEAEAEAHGGDNEESESRDAEK